MIESRGIYLDRAGSCPVSSFHGVSVLAKSSSHRNKGRQKGALLNFDHVSEGQEDLKVLSTGKTEILFFCRFSVQNIPLR